MPFEEVFKEFVEWSHSAGTGDVDNDPTARAILGDNPLIYPFYVKYMEEQAMSIMLKSMSPEVDVKTVLCASLDLMFNVGRYIQRQLDKETKSEGQV